MQVMRYEVITYRKAKQYFIPRDKPSNTLEVIINDSNALRYCLFDSEHERVAVGTMTHSFYIRYLAGKHYAGKFTVASLLIYGRDTLKEELRGGLIRFLDGTLTLAEFVARLRKKG